MEAGKARRRVPWLRLRRSVAKQRRLAPRSEPDRPAATTSKKEDTCHVLQGRHNPQHGVNPAALHAMGAQTAPDLAGINLAAQSSPKHPSPLSGTRRRGRLRRQEEEEARHPREAATSGSGGTGGTTTRVSWRACFAEAPYQEWSRPCRKSGAFPYRGRVPKTRENLQPLRESTRRNHATRHEWCGAPAGPGPTIFREAFEARPRSLVRISVACGPVPRSAIGCSPTPLAGHCRVRESWLGRPEGGPRILASSRPMQPR